jgi:RNA polymerase sigma-70 factor (ECF subfamily)
MPDEDTATQAWDGEWERVMLARCLGEIQHEVAGRTYRAFELVVLQGYGADDAAKELGMSRAAVYTAKHRVLKRVRELKQELEGIS